MIILLTLIISAYLIGRKHGERITLIRVKRVLEIRYEAQCKASYEEDKN